MNADEHGLKKIGVHRRLSAAHSDVFTEPEGVVAAGDMKW
jgi:hypothetical protein